MATHLTVGQTLSTTAGIPCLIEDFLGSGGQGEVYHVALGNRALALKWYHPEIATPEQREALTVLLKKGAPCDTFLWPIDIITNGSRFGYLMPLRDKRFASGIDLLCRRIDPSFRILATVGLTLAQGFLELHSRGLCYCDVSLHNVFFDPRSGEVLICDNDNVIINGTPPRVLGTPRYMAPEVVRGEAHPDSQTDLFSLAVLLFYMFMMHHPLEGKRETEIHCLDLPAMSQLYGTKPVFIFDPNDSSNRPVPGIHDNAIALWPLYPNSFRNLFVQSFTAGLRDSENGRVRESEWRLAMARLRDGIIYCACGAESIYEPAPLNGPPSPAPNCWACNRRLVLPPLLSVGRHLVMLNRDTQLFPHHLDDRRLYDFSQPLLEVTAHPQDQRRWGLRNLTTQPLQATTPNGQTVSIELHQSIGLQHGLRIQYGKAQGEVRSLV